MSACSNDDDEENMGAGEIMSNDNGKIVDNGDNVVYSYSQNMSGAEVDFEMTFYFKDDALYKVIEKVSITPAMLAEPVYEQMCEEWEQMFNAKPTLSGNVITCDVKADQLMGCSKSMIITALKEELTAGPDEEEEED